MGVLFWEGATGRFERRVSWMPGAEGAPVVFDAGEFVERLEVEVEVRWEAGGTMRYDWSG